MAAGLHKAPPYCTSLTPSPRGVTVDTYQCVDSAPRYGERSKGVKTQRLLLVCCALGATGLHHSVEGASMIEFEGKCFGVSTYGETVSVARKIGNTMRIERVRLEGVDFPEKGQSFGSQAQQSTRAMVCGRQVQFKCRRLDGVLVGRVTLEDGRVLNEEVLKRGLAWWDRRKWPKRTDLAECEKHARGRRKGLWSQRDPMAPWDFRLQKQKEAQEEALAEVRAAEAEEVLREQLRLAGQQRQARLNRILSENPGLSALDIVKLSNMMRYRQRFSVAEFTAFSLSDRRLIILAGRAPAPTTEAERESPEGKLAMIVSRNPHLTVLQVAKLRVLLKRSKPISTTDFIDLTPGDRRLVVLAGMGPQ